MSGTEAGSLNQIVQIIDQKAAEYKDHFFTLTPAQKIAQKKLILDLIDDANGLAKRLSPVPVDLLHDLQELSRQLSRLGG